MSQTMSTFLNRLFGFAGGKVTKQPTRQSRTSRLSVELLEERTLLSVTADEQLFVYLLNQARHDPVAYQHDAGLSVDLSAVAPRPPLAVNDHLMASSQFHVQEMATSNYFGHQSQVTGEWPDKMVRYLDYPLPSLFPDNQNSFESTASC